MTHCRKHERRRTGLLERGHGLSRLCELCSQCGLGFWFVFIKMHDYDDRIRYSTDDRPSKMSIINLKGLLY